MEQTTQPYASGKNWTLYAGECGRVMRDCVPDESVDLCVTSPPYDNLRSYNGFEFDFFKIARELIRVIKPGGVIVWVVGDATIDGSETGTSFKQALYFKAKGLRLHDTMIYEKSGYPFPESNRYNPVMEYMFIFTKGSPKTFNPIDDRVNAYAGDRVARRSAERQKDGNLKPNTAWRNGSNARLKKTGVRTNIWRYSIGGGNIGDKFVHAHPAAFPEPLARDHIVSWSNPGDIVLDPFIGSGTTAKMALMLNRRTIGIDISPEYLEIAKRRIDLARLPLFEQLDTPETAEQLTLELT